MRFALPTFLLLALLALGCRPESEPAPPAPAPSAKESAPPRVETPTPEPPVVLTEFPSLALPAWRAPAAEQPTLVLLSQDPFLYPIPESLREQALALAVGGTPRQLAEHAAPDRPAPQLLPVQVLRAALDAGLFAGVVWVLPIKDAPELLDVEVFRRQMLFSGQLSDAEAETLKAAEGGFAFSISGVPVTAVHPEKLPELSGAVVVHVDLSYFQNLYRNEVKTPVFELMRQTLSALYQRGWDIRAATHSLGQAEGRVSADMRFLGHRLARILADPSLLERPLPPIWQEQAEIIYLATFLEMDKVLEKAAHLAARAPQDAPAHFELYRALRARRAGDEALMALARAVQLDPGYAVEYLNLAALARNRELPDKELEMLDIARRLDPANPFVALRMAEIHREQGEMEQARLLLDALRALPWSKEYFPDLPELMETLSEPL